MPNQKQTKTAHKSINTFVAAITTLFINLIEEQGKSSRLKKALENKEYAQQIENMIIAEMPARAPKDPEAPKRPKSAYLCWAAEYREELSKRVPKLTFKEISNELSRAWKSMSDEDKAPFEAQHEKLKKKYEKEKKKYVPPTPQILAERIAEVKAKKKEESKAKREANRKITKKQDERAPESAKTAYRLWVDDHKDDFQAEARETMIANTNSEKGHLQLARQNMSAAWDAIKQKAKAKGKPCKTLRKYTKLAEEDKARFEAEYAQYLEDCPDGPPPKVEKPKKQRGRPKKSKKDEASDDEDEPEEEPVKEKKHKHKKDKKHKHKKDKKRSSVVISGLDE